MEYVLIMLYRLSVVCISGTGPDGRTAAKIAAHLAALISIYDIPVMFLTGKGDRESIMSVLALKPAGYLLKSIDRDGLNKALDGFFARLKVAKVQGV